MPSELSSNNPTSTTSKIKKTGIIKDNRPGLLDDMVFYMHEYMGNYMGQGRHRFEVKREILAKGGQIVYSPTDPSVTHILVPPDREARQRSEDSSSILNLREIQNQTYNTKTKEEVAFWDIPKLVLFFGQHLNEDGEIIKDAEVPVLRMGWILRCVKKRRILVHEDGDWDGQFLRARIFPDFHAKPRPDARPIQAIEMGGQGVSREHLDFARQMSSGGSMTYNARPINPSAPTSAYQPRRHLVKDEIRDQAYPPKDWTRTIPMGAKVNRWSALTNAQETSKKPQSPVHVFPKADQLSVSVSAESVIDTQKLSSRQNCVGTAVINEHQSPVVNSLKKSSSQSSSPQHTCGPEPKRSEANINETHVPMTPISSFGPISHDQPDQTQQPNRKRESPLDMPPLALDPRQHLKRRKIQDLAETKVTEDERPPTPPLPEEMQTILPIVHQAKSKLPSPPETSPNIQVTGASPVGTRAKQIMDNSQSVNSRSGAKSKSVTPSSSSRITQASPAIPRSTSKIFFANGRPMTFNVHQGNFATQFLIQSGGGVIMPIEHASTIIFDRKSSKQPCTAEEEDVLDGVELRGEWQVVVSSKWIEDCLRNGKQIEDPNYRITKVPQSVAIPEDYTEHEGRPDHDTMDVDYNSDEEESVICLSENRPALAVRPRIEPAKREERKPVVDSHLLPRMQNPSAGPSLRSTAIQTCKADRSRSSSHNQRHNNHLVKSHKISGGTTGLKGIKILEERKERSSNTSKGVRKVTGSKSSVQGIDQSVNILVEEMRCWNPKNCRRTKFLNELTKKRPERHWRKFFDRHRSKILSRFDQLGYIYPDTNTIKMKMQKKKQEEEREDDDDDLEELISDHEEDSIYEPSVN
ncbi:hypothetical protein I203_103227 [Kwoniella mangroviensis CBS 8507]|uniref:uncharacterized protein n=1 Tax=Kwoniella mangroviensis CBS 8507 TaxID=1296122 RepID=UPI00080D4862|nr:uncharacterized protein I203_07399 [Kwoniella mangroviensis CBS 8507]OCF63335.1 hypothetical protein I203_07399 [Kwoniella mangroviensis CBS 8507]